MSQLQYVSWFCWEHRALLLDIHILSLLLYGMIFDCVLVVKYLFGNKSLLQSPWKIVKPRQSSKEVMRAQISKEESCHHPPEGCT